MGPAPARKSKGNRMSPPGISYTYLSEDRETASLEVQHDIPSPVWIVEFTTKKPLRLVDLTGKSLAIPSIFDPLYDHERRLLVPTLIQFAKEISQHIEPEDEELDYVPTQVMTEYFRAQEADGIRYMSARRDGGTNIVLFCGRRLLEEGLLPELEPGAPDKWSRSFESSGEWLVVHSCSRVPSDQQSHPG